MSDLASSERPLKLYEAVLKHAPTTPYPFWPSIVTVLSPKDSLAVELRGALPPEADGETWISLSPSEVAQAYVYKRW
jgi:hypothetical protein